MSTVNVNQRIVSNHTADVEVEPTDPTNSDTAGAIYTQGGMSLGGGIYSKSGQLYLGRRDLPGSRWVTMVSTTTHSDPPDPPFRLGIRLYERKTSTNSEFGFILYYDNETNNFYIDCAQGGSTGTFNCMWIQRSTGDFNFTSNINVTDTVTGGTITDGTASLSSGNLTGVDNVTASGTITDGTALLSSGNLTGVNNVTASGTITDGTSLINDGSITNTRLIQSSIQQSANDVRYSEGNVQTGIDTVSGSVTDGSLIQRDSKTNTTGVYTTAAWGNTMVTGLYTATSSTGKVVVYTLGADAITAQTTLTADDAEPYEYFGYSVGIFGNTVVVGAYGGKTSDTGAAYVFTRSGTTWTQQQKLTASDAANGDKFGFSVSIYDETIVVGASDKNSNTGAAYVFTRSETTWTQQQKLTASDAELDDNFGYSVTLCEDTVVVGAPFEDTGGTSAGAVYIYTRVAGTWTEYGTIFRGAAGGDNYGISVSLYDDTLVVGASGSLNNQGSVYPLTRNGSTWTQHTALVASSPFNDDSFGRGVSVFLNTVYITAPGGKKIYMFRGPYCHLSDTCDMDMSGNLAVGGSLTKASGTFYIPHPLPAMKDTHKLVHSFVEGARADNMYRGAIQMNNTAQQEINLDTSCGMTEGTFASLNRDVQVFCTNADGWTLVRGRVVDNVLTIETQVACDDTINWLVIGERQDDAIKDNPFTDEEGHFILEHSAES